MTQEEFETYEEIQVQISHLKQKLAETDYKAIKFAEGELTAEEYAPIREQRRTWRQEINELENEKPKKPQMIIT